jgi:hypothetical protein
VSLRAALEAFAAEHAILGKGALAVVIQMTDRALRDGLPLDADRLLTARGGQVAGLGGDNLARILAELGENRRLAREAGRTSRGSIDTARVYIAFLNDLHARGPVDVEAVQAFWLERVRAFLASKPLRLTFDPALSVQAMLGRVVVQAEARQRERGGQTLVGALVQHLVGAKLDLVRGGAALMHHPASASDERPGRGGDFDLGDTSVHVTTAPGEWVVARCRDNLAAGRRPVIVTVPTRVAAARALAEDAGLGERIDVLDAAQFLAANVFEMGGFEAEGRLAAFAAIVQRYNALIEAHEDDPGLAIALG